MKKRSSTSTVTRACASVPMGWIGNKIIVIDGGSPQAPIVQNGDVLQAEKLLSTDDMLKTLQQNNQNLLAITTDLNF